MKLKIKPAVKLYLAIGGIALLLTLALYPLMPDWFQKYKVHITKNSEFIPNPNIVYHDFDHDGNSEMFALKYQQNLDQSAAKIYNMNGDLIGQRTFCERWLERAFAFGDYDNDGHDEAYIFTQDGDSLFLYSFDINRRHKFNLYRVFIASVVKPNPNPKGVWDVAVFPGGFMDSDDDGYKDFIFGLVSAFSLQPRRYYVFSPHKKAIIFRSPKSGVNFISPQCVDLDGDGEKEIINRGSAATGNSHRAMRYKDDKAWLFVFNKKLNFKIKPVPFGRENSSIEILPFNSNHEGKIVVVHSYSGPYNINSEVVLLDAAGVKRKVRKFDKTGELYAFSAPEKDKALLCVYDSKGHFYFLDSMLNTLSQKYNPQIRGLLEKRADIDGDFIPELIFLDKKVLTITRADLSDPVCIEIPDWQSGGSLLSVKKQKGKASLLSVQNKENYFLISYGKNPWYLLLYPFWLSVYGLIFLILYFIFHTANYSKAYSRALAFVLHNPHRGILILNQQGKIRQINNTLVKQLNLSDPHLKNRKYTQVFRDLPQVNEFLEQTVQSKEPQNKEVLISGAGISFRGQFFARPIYGIFNYPSGYYFETNDYAQPVQSDRLKVWSKTVQKMAHDIKTPLSSISINLSTVRMKLKDLNPEVWEKVEGDLEIMLGEMERVRAMTKNFLKFTNLEQPNLNVFSLGLLVQDVLDRFKSYYANTLNLMLEFDFEPDFINADYAQIKMALQALIENAIDAVKGNGVITVSVSAVDKIDEGFKKYVEIEIRDNGPGIPAKDKDHIFEPYFTSKKDGTGMGLAIAKKIIEDHHGSLDLISKENFATVFRIMLPIGNILT